MNKSKIIAVTLVTALCLLTCVVPVSAYSTDGATYKQGGFVPPVSNSTYARQTVLFIPYEIRNGNYFGHYFQFDDDIIVRLYFRNRSDISHVGLQFFRNTRGDGTISYYISDLVQWHSNSTLSWSQKRYAVTENSGKFGTAINLYSRSPENLIFNHDVTWDNYVINDSFYNKGWINNTTFTLYPTDSMTGDIYTYPYPLVSTSEGWAYNYVYESEKDEQNAIDESRYHEQNKIIQDGFSQVYDSINNASDEIVTAVNNAADKIVNAGSNAPALNTEQNGLTEVISNLNKWVSDLGAFENQMKSNEAENSENMAQAKGFINGFFSVVPPALIACFSLFLVIIVVVKLVGR